MSKAAILALVVVASALVGCDPAPVDVREWKAQDHDQVSAQSTGPARRQAAQGDAVDLVELAWQKNCVSCHGARGRGDGPQGPMLHAPDLTRPDWQDKTSDAQIAIQIRTGKNKMPAFDLPGPVIDGLVRRIRAARAK